MKTVVHLWVPSRIRARFGVPGLGAFKSDHRFGSTGIEEGEVATSPVFHGARASEV